MNLAQTKPATRNQFQVRLDELHETSIALYAEAISNPSEAVVEKIEAIAIEREKVYQEWEASWNDPATAAPAASIPAASKAVAASPTAIGTNSEELPNRGDNGRGRVQPTAATKKLMLSLVSVKRISSDIPATNFDRNELEIAGELSLTIGGFCSPPVLRRDGNNYKVISGHFQYHAAVLARRLNPRAGETIPAIVLEAENQSAVLAQLGILKLRAA
jgi:hypothetical protein